MKTIFFVKNATLYNGDTCVFEDLNLQIDRGCNTAIIGANGSGKSTLLKLLSGELYPVVNPLTVVKLLGKERCNKYELREQMGMVSHDLQSHTVDRSPGLNVVLSGYFDSNSLWNHHKVSDEQIDNAIEILKTMGIESLRRRVYGGLSTGQQRRLLLARALINQPNIMLFDEPTTGLDMQGAYQILNIMRKMMQEGTSLLLVTHHLAEISPEIERVILLKDGQIFADGTKTDVLTDSNVSKCFGVKVKIVSHNGFYDALPQGK